MTIYEIAKVSWWRFRLKRLGLQVDDTAGIAAFEDFQGAPLDTWPNTGLNAGLDDFKDAVFAVCETYARTGDVDALGNLAVFVEGVDAIMSEFSMGDEPLIARWKEHRLQLA